MAKRKVEKGDHVKLSGEVTRIGEDGWITVHIYGYGYPVTLHENYLDEVTPGPKEPHQSRKKIYDKPD